MSNSEFLEIASYASSVEAEHVRSVLQEHGVSAFIDGATANTALSYVGSALGGVKVFVRTADAKLARVIVENVRAESDVSAAPWFCGACEETIEGAFELCWSCGEARANAEQPFPVAGDGVRSVGEKSDSDRDGDDEAVARPSVHSGYDAANPYASPLTPDTTESPSEEPLELNEEAEAMLLRAWRASILGLVFLPFLLHLYSMYLLVRATMIATTFSPAGQKRFYLAFVVNVVAGCAWGMVIKLWWT